MRFYLPKSWNEVTVETFQELFPILTSEVESGYKRPVIISVLTGKSLKEVKSNYTLKDYKATDLSWLHKFDELKSEGDTFFIDGVRYSIDKDINNMSGGQYMTFMHILKECEGDEIKVVNNLHRLLACLIVKDEKKLFGWKKGSYDDKIFDELSETIKKKCSAAVAYPLSVFFYQVLENLISVMNEFGNQQLDKANKIIEEVAKDLEKHGDGM